MMNFVSDLSSVRCGRQRYWETFLCFVSEYALKKEQRKTLYAAFVWMAVYRFVLSVMSLS